MRGSNSVDPFPVLPGGGECSRVRDSCPPVLHQSVCLGILETDHLPGRHRRAFHLVHWLAAVAHLLSTQVRCRTLAYPARSGCKLRRCYRGGQLAAVEDRLIAFDAGLRELGACCHRSRRACGLPIQGCSGQRRGHRFNYRSGSRHSGQTWREEAGHTHEGGVGQ